MRSAIPVPVGTFVAAVLRSGTLKISVRGSFTAVNIRKFVVRATALDDLVQLGTLSGQAARFLEAAVSSGLNILVAGGTQAGKPALR